MSKSEIVRLIWDVESFHGLALSVKLKNEDDPDAAINCKFEDFEWLTNNLKLNQDTQVKSIDHCSPRLLMPELPPNLPYKSRIQIWVQGKFGYQVGTFHDAQKAFKSFESTMTKLGGTWDDVLAIWSDPRNKPSLLKLGATAKTQTEYLSQSGLPLVDF